MSKKQKYILFVLIICIVTIGQAIKCILVNNFIEPVVIIKEMLKINFVKNTGGAFGLGNEHTWIFIILNIIILTTIFIYMLRKKNISKVEFFSEILVLSGGIGNLIDRIFRGYVVDYLDINPLIKYPVFNLEDMLIVVGMLLIMISIVKKDVGEGPVSARE